MTVTFACAAAHAVAVAFATAVLRACAAAMACPPPQTIATAAATALADEFAASTMVPELAVATDVTDPARYKQLSSDIGKQTGVQQGEEHADSEACKYSLPDGNAVTVIPSGWICIVPS